MENYEKKFYVENELIRSPYYKKDELTDILVAANIGLFNAFEKITANDVEHLMITNPEMIINEKKGFRR